MISLLKLLRRRDIEEEEEEEEVDFFSNRAQPQDRDYNATYFDLDRDKTPRQLSFNYSWDLAEMAI